MTATVRSSLASFYNENSIKLSRCCLKYWLKGLTNRQQIVLKIMLSWGVSGTATTGRGAGVGVGDCKKYCDWVLAKVGGGVILVF